MNLELQIAVLDLLSKWRNITAHSGDRKARLTPQSKELLIERRTEIHQEYSHLDIELAIRNFESRKVAVGKEVTSLLAIATNLCRSIDQAAIKRIASTEEGMDMMVEKLLIEYFLESDHRNLKPWSELSEAWQGSETRRKKNLLKILQRVGVSSVEQSNVLKPESKSSLRKTPMSASLSQIFLNELLALDRHTAAARLGIAAK